MMKNIRLAGAVCILTLTTLISCKRTLYNHPDDAVSHYFIPLEVGKYAIYQVDSTNFYYYGQLDTITHYLVKDTVESSWKDDLGQTVYAIIRYISPATGSPSWETFQTNTATATSRSLEYTENNLRFIKLAYPVSTNLSWSGNSYLPDAPYQSTFKFTAPSNVNLNQWVFSYQNINQPFTAGSNTYDSTITVLQEDDSANVPIIVDTAFASRTYWTETYAKNIGLVYRRSILWEYQPPVPNSTQGGYKIGFQVTLTLIDHN